MLKVLGYLWPRRGDDHMRQYEWRVFVALTLYVLIGFMALTWTALTVGVPLLGSLSWRADTVRTIDSHIEAATGPIRVKIDKLAGDVLTQSASSNRLSAVVARSNILEINRRLCTEKDAAEQDRLKGEMDTYLDEYHNSMQHEFPQELLHCRR